MATDKPIKPLHPKSHYKTIAMLMGKEYNERYHMFLQRGGGSDGPPFMAWDADTMELIAHSTYPLPNEFPTPVPGFTEKWQERYKVEGHEYPPEPKEEET